MRIRSVFSYVALCGALFGCGFVPQHTQTSFWPQELIGSPVIGNGVLADSVRRSLATTDVARTYRLHITESPLQQTVTSYDVAGDESGYRLRLTAEVSVLRGDTRIAVIPLAVSRVITHTPTSRTVATDTRTIATDLQQELQTMLTYRLRALFTRMETT